MEFLAPKLHWVLGGGHRVEGHADGKSKLRPGFLVTDRPPHATVTVPPRRGSRASIGRVAPAVT